jgi:hypothetical protein
MLQAMRCCMRPGMSQLACMLRRLLTLARRLLQTLMLDGSADDGHVTGMRTY